MAEEPVVNKDDQKKNVPEAFDPSKLGDEDLQKVLEDPRLWKTQRLTELSQKAKKAATYEEEKKKLEEAKLKEQGELGQLNERLTKERDEAIAQANNTKIDMKLSMEAAKIGCVDTEAALKLIDKSTLKVGEDGTITGITEAIEALKTSKPYLFGEPGQKTVGNPTNPSKDGSSVTKKFKHSQLLDPVFYKENEADILKALAAGQVENDL